MYSKLLIFFLLCSIQCGIAQSNLPYENNETYTFDEAVTAYQELADQFPQTCRLLEVGSSDFGLPMPLFIINASGVFTKEEYLSKTVLLINNAIHPGEPCGVDASVKLAKELLSETAIPQNVIVAIIPVYNIGGAHNRNCCSRANQNGPKEYGFRGNSKNLDLNRDFIKADSKNVLAFYSIFHLLKPAIFIDTHTSNGADYQHTMTLITSQLNKMNPALAAYTRTTLNPYLFSKMNADKYPMVPYVHTMKSTPDHGIFDYLETPRYSTGYTNLFNTISYVTEAHMLKSYEDRVNATYLFLRHMVDFMEKNQGELKAVREKSAKELLVATALDLNWTLDTMKYDTIPFMGYAARYKTSQVTGIDRLYYDRKSPYEKYIKYYNTYNGNSTVTVPQYYVIPQTWDIIVERLKANDILIYELTEDAVLTVEQYEITDYETVNAPYEGHYLHYNIAVDKVEKQLNYRAGDFLVPTGNSNMRFIVETLEPHAPDSYFAWNYFDAILQQKEWFSGYVFEDEAAQMLAEDPELKAEFEERKQADSTFASNAFAQLYFLYKKSPNYERSHNQYPITRLIRAGDGAFSIQKMD